MAITLVPLLAPSNGDPESWLSDFSWDKLGQKAVSKPMVRSGKARFVHFQDSQGEDSHSLRWCGGNTVNMCEQWKVKQNTAETTAHVTVIVDDVLFSY